MFLVCFNLTPTACTNCKVHWIRTATWWTKPRLCTHRLDQLEHLHSLVNLNYWPTSHWPVISWVRPIRLGSREQMINQSHCLVFPVARCRSFFKRKRTRNGQVIMFYSLYQARKLLTRDTKQKALLCMEVGSFSVKLLCMPLSQSQSSSEQVDPIKISFLTFIHQWSSFRLICFFAPFFCRHPSKFSCMTKFLQDIFF